MSGWAQCRCIFSSVSSCRRIYVFRVSSCFWKREKNESEKNWRSSRIWHTEIFQRPYASMCAWRCYLCGFFFTLWQDHNTNTYAHLAHRAHRRPWPVFRFLVVSSVRLFTQPQLSHVLYDFCSVLLCMAYPIISVFRCRLFFSCARVKFNGLVWRVPIELLCFQITNNNRIQFISSWCQ